MRTRLSRVFPSIRDDFETRRAANDACFGSSPVSALQPLAQAPSDAAGNSWIVRNNDDDDHYWLGGYAGI